MVRDGGVGVGVCLYRLVVVDRTDQLLRNIARVLSITPLDPIENFLPLPNTHYRFPLDNQLNPVSIDGARLNSLQMLQSLVQQESLLIGHDDLQMILLANLRPIVVLNRHDGREYHLGHSVPVF